MLQHCNVVNLGPMHAINSCMRNKTRSANNLSVWITHFNPLHVLMKYAPNMAGALFYAQFDGVTAPRVHDLSSPCKWFCRRVATPQLSAVFRPWVARSWRSSAPARSDRARPWLTTPRPPPRRRSAPPARQRTAACWPPPSHTWPGRSRGFIEKF